jgi:hypothetical protein
MNTKFNVGDEVEVISSGKVGFIKEITNYGNGETAYIVEIEGMNKVLLESNLTIIRKVNKVVDLDIEELSAQFQIEDRINEIIEKLGLVKPENEETQLLNAAKLQMYLATLDENGEIIKANIGSSVTTSELFDGLMNGKTDSIVNAYIFSEILNKVGNKVLNVALKDENGEYYIANLVLIGDDYFYFDVTLERSVFMENGGELNNFVLCCGALGRGSYEQFFKPLCLIDFHDKLKENKLPENIAKLDIDIDLVNKLINI